MCGRLEFGLSSLMVGLYAFVHSESFTVTICEEVMYAFVFRCHVSSCFSCSRCHSYSYAFLRGDHWGSRSVQRSQTLSRSSWLWGRNAKAGFPAVLSVCYNDVSVVDFADCIRSKELTFCAHCIHLDGLMHYSSESSLFTGRQQRQPTLSPHRRETRGRSEKSQARGNSWLHSFVSTYPQLLFNKGRNHLKKCTGKVLTSDTKHLGCPGDMFFSFISIKTVRYLISLYIYLEAGCLF